MYKKKYVGSLEITKEGNVYSCIIGLPSPNMPTHISIQAESDEDFLKYIKEELRTRNLVRTYFYSVRRSEIENKKPDTKVIKSDEA